MILFFFTFKTNSLYYFLIQYQGPEKPVYKSKTKFDDVESEPLLRENPRRFVLLPIQYKDIWQMYKKAEGRLVLKQKK